MIVGAGGSGGGTDWWSMDMETLQALAQAPDTAAYDKIADGWKKTLELISGHQTEVTNYRNNLAEAWPPSKNKAAAAYIDRLDALLEHLDSTYEAASANHEALSDASASIKAAKVRMNQYYADWKTNHQSLTDYTDQQGQDGVVSPPLTQKQLDKQVRVAADFMSTVSTELAQAQARIVQPTTYTPHEGYQDRDRNKITGREEPVGPPPIMTVPYSGGSGGSASNQTSFTTSHAFQTSTNHSGIAGGALSSLASSSNSIPGNNQHLTLSANNGLPISSGPPSISPSPAQAVGGGPGIGPIFSPSGRPTSSNIGDRIAEGTNMKPVRRETAVVSDAGTRAMPPSGPLGKTSTGAFGEADAPRLRPQRVNPVGGLIGEPGVGGAGPRGSAGSVSSRTAQAGKASTLPQQPYGQMSGKRSNRRDGSDNPRWDPQDPWATDEGVDPVILPPSDKPFDPGPAIGLR